MMTNKFNKSVIAMSASAALTSLNVHAAVLEEVVVTAQKRAQSVNDISVSASAFGGDQIRDLGIESAVDLGAHTPGLVTVNSTSGGTPIFAIRGIGLDDFSANNTSGVGVYTDEVFASNPAFLSGQLFDIERVEVLKGPQGTLYGKNTTGGAINFVSNKPSDTFESYVELGVGSYGLKEVTAAVSGPVSDQVLGRLAIDYTDADGWQNDVKSNREFGSQDRYALRGILDFPLGEDGSATLRGYFTKDDSIPVSPQVSGLGDALGDPSFDALNSSAQSDKVDVGDLNVSRDEEGMGLALTLNFSFESFDVISISSFDNYERKVVDNYGGSAAAILDLFQDNEMQQWAQELRVVSDDSAFFTWVAGVNISQEEVEVIDSFDDSLLVSDSASVNFVFDPADIALRGADILTANYTQKTDSYGAYFHSETSINDSLRLIAGIRYSYDDRSFDGISTNHDADLSFNDTVTSLNENHDEEAVTGKIGLDWQASDDLLVYANIANSYKSGAYYGAAILDDISWDYVNPEKVLSYELGFKATLLEGSMQLNGALFKLDYKDRQSLVSIIVDDFSNALGFGVVDTTLINVPESETFGFELDMQWLPTDALTVGLGVAYLDTEVTQAPMTADMRGIDADASVNSSADGVTTPFVDALAAPLPNGVSLSQSPEWSYNGLIAYEFNVGADLGLKVQTSYSRTSEMSAQLADANAVTGPLSSWDARLSLYDHNERWTSSLWVKNIEDSSAESYSFSSFAGRAFYRQMPTTYGLSVRFNLN